MRRILACSIFFCGLIVSIVAVAQTPADKLEVAYPGKTWTVVINSSGFVTKVNGMQKNGRQYLLATNDKSGMELSVSLERTSSPADVSTCPAYLRKRVDGLQPLGLQDVKYLTAAGMAAAEYLVPEVKGYKVRQRNLITCTAKEDVYVDVHLSKVQFKPEDEPLFMSLVNSVSIVDSPSATVKSKPSSSREFMETGSRYFIQGHNKEAIAPYQQALDLEKKHRELDKNLWFVLVDNLGMAYGITGDLDNAEATFRYGLAEELTYPMFYYNMACVYGERNDLEHTLDYLKKAFSYKANVIPGEKMPDPLSDDSFRRFRDEPKFRALVASLNSGK